MADVVRVVVGLCLATCTTQAAPRLRVESNVRFGGLYSWQTDMTPSLFDFPPDRLVERWDSQRGFNLIGGFACGTKIVASSADGARTRYGRLVVFATGPDGQGPTGSGDYVVSLPDEAIGAASNGRMSVRYGSYRDGEGAERYAWLAFLSEQPLNCACNWQEEDNPGCTQTYSEVEKLLPSSAASDSGTYTPCRTAAGGCMTGGGVLASCTEVVGADQGYARRVCDMMQGEFLPRGCPRDAPGFRGCCERAKPIPGAPSIKPIRTCTYNTTSGVFDFEEICEADGILGPGVVCP